MHERRDLGGRIHRAEWRESACLFREWPGAACDRARTTGNGRLQRNRRLERRHGFGSKRRRPKPAHDRHGLATVTDGGRPTRRRRRSRAARPQERRREEKITGGR